ncbi:hypothetical protein PYCC9005_000606 [Savitreella phatthalungensis]
MMERMGYRKGDTLGTRGGLLEPLSAQRAPSRSGLGSAAQQIQQKRPEYRLDSSRQILDQEEFRASISSESDLKRCARQVKAAQRVCQNLESRADAPDRPPVEYRELTGAVDSETQQFMALDQPTRLARILKYLVDKHHYCFWCAVRYDNLEDLLKNCPGPLEAHHE